MILGLIFAYLLHISLCLARKPFQPRFPRNPPGPDFQKKCKGHQRHQTLRSIFDSVFKGYFSDGLPLISVATSDVDASSSGDSDPPAHDSKNLVRQKSRLFPTMFHILPPRTPKVMAYLRSAALKPLFFAIGLINLSDLPLGMAKHNENHGNQGFLIIYTWTCPYGRVQG